MRSRLEKLENPLKTEHLEDGLDLYKKFSELQLTSAELRDYEKDFKAQLVKPRIHPVVPN